MSDIWLPVGMVTSGWGIPPVCLTHGVEGGPTRQATITFRSRPPVWAFALGLLVADLMRTSVVATGWPVCLACGARRRRWQVVAGALGALTVVLVVLGFGTGSAPALIAAIFPPLLVFVAIDRASWGQGVRGVVERDGGSVRFSDAAPSFVAMLPPNPQAPQPVSRAWPAAHPGGMSITPGP